MGKPPLAQPVELVCAEGSEDGGLLADTPRPLRIKGPWLKGWVHALRNLRTRENGQAALPRDSVGP